MSYKVMLVDDEIWSVRGLSKLLPWKEAGFEVLSLETDSKEALEHLAELSPDVVFTDIRMPELSGLELMRLVHEERPWILFVVVSGHNDFQYVQQAMRYGAFDYFLKPIDILDGQQLLSRIRVKLDKDRMTADGLTCAQLVSGERGVVDILNEHGLKNNGGAWLVLVIIASEDEPSPEAGSCPEFNAMPCLTLIPEIGKTIIILHGDLDPGVIETTVRSWAKRSYRSFIGISGEGSRAPDLPSLLIEAESAASGAFFERPPAVCKFSSRPCPELNQLISEIGSSFSSCDDLRTVSLIDRLPLLVRKENLGLFHVEYFGKRFWNFLMEWNPASAQIQSAESMDALSISKRFKNLEAFCVHLKKLVISEATTSPLHSSQYVGANSQFLEILDFINKNYSHKLSLARLAEKHHLNLSYCCELFRKYTNGTFSEYVTGLRLKKAWQLLSSGRHGPQEVAELIGYNDYYYFSRIFKKQFNLPPSHLRPETKSIEHA